MSPYKMADEIVVDDTPEESSTEQNESDESHTELDPNLPCFLIVKNLVDEVFEETDEKVRFIWLFFLIYVLLLELLFF